jgi:hypothetical protein
VDPDSEHWKLDVQTLLNFNKFNNCVKPCGDLLVRVQTEFSSQLSREADGSGSGGNDVRHDGQEGGNQPDAKICQVKKDLKRAALNPSQEMEFLNGNFSRGF